MFLACTMPGTFTLTAHVAVPFTLGGMSYRGIDCPTNFRS